MKLLLILLLTLGFQSSRAEMVPPTPPSSEPQGVKLTLSVEGEGSVAIDQWKGIGVAPPVNSFTYPVPINEEITATATPMVGWYLKEWRTDFAVEDPYSTTVPFITSVPHTITAVFKYGPANKLNVEIVNDESPAGYPIPIDGKVTGSSLNCGKVCTRNMGPLPVAQLFANPGPGVAFNGWSGDASGTQTLVTIPMNGTRNVIAHFGMPIRISFFPVQVTTEAPYKKVGKSGGGGVLVAAPAKRSLPDSPGGWDYDYPTNQTPFTFTPVPDPGFEYVGFFDEKGNFRSGASLADISIWRDGRYPLELAFRELNPNPPIPMPSNIPSPAIPEPSPMPTAR